MATPDSFRAFRIHEVERKVQPRYETLRLDDLAAGEVVVRVAYSDINYKDALAATGAGRILRKYPLVGGIDLSGVVVSSTDARWKAGDEVLVTGCDLSENYDGGYAEYARVRADSVIAMPPGLTPRQAMQLGTAGFTAALAIHRMEQNGQKPEGGPIVVTGASGGVGSLAIDMLAGRGYEVVAVSGKPEADDYLRGLGAARILRRQEIDLGGGPLLSPKFAGAIDNVGGDVLGWLLRVMDFRGNVASIGLAQSAKLEGTVLPFILRGVSMLGINSSATPRWLRLQVWERIATDLRPRHLDTLCAREIPFAELPSAFQPYIDNAIQGRALVRIGA